jgi:hypothetical protein
VFIRKADYGFNYMTSYFVRLRFELRFCCLLQIKNRTQYVFDCKQSSAGQASHRITRNTEVFVPSLPQHATFRYINSDISITHFYILFCLFNCTIQNKPMYPKYFSPFEYFPVCYMYCQSCVT